MKITTPSIVTVASVGTTALLPQGDDKITSDNQAFARSGQTTAVAGVTSLSQIKNPAASGRTLYVDSVSLINLSGAGIIFHVGLKNADLTTLVGTGHSKNSGGAAGVGQVRVEAVNVALDANMEILALAAGLGDTVVFSPPVKLEAGEGVGVLTQSVNVSILTAFQWREYA